MNLDKKILIGTAGWNYKDWNGIVYPPSKPKDFSELKYIAQFIDVLEINSTFYRIPSVNSAEKWIAQTDHNPHFKFTVKLYQKFTHENDLNSSEIGQFKYSLYPFQGAGKLGALLMQFPWRFKHEQKSVDHLENLLEEFAQFPCAVEFRHSSWFNEQLFARLNSRNASLVNIDQPVIGKSIKPANVLTNKTGYVRLHGRNYSDWFRDSAGRDARYDYLYKESELDEWANRIRDISQKAETTFVIFNNHFRGQAFVNAMQLSAMLFEKKVEAPATLIQAHPALSALCYSNEPGQQNLFG